MANNSILVLTEFGFGKTTSLSKNEELGIMEGLNPKETVILNVKGKPLSFRGWRNNYKTGLKSGGNYAETTDPVAIVEIMEYVNKERPEIHNFVLDDAQYIMAQQFMDDALKTGFEKFSKLGRNMYNVINKGIKLRDDLNFIVLAHQEETKTSYKMLTIGRMLDEKVKLEGLFTCILFGDTALSDEKTVTKRFVSNNDGHYPARSPHGMFSDLYIPTDMGYVIRKINEYNSGEIVLTEKKE